MGAVLGRLVRFYLIYDITSEDDGTCRGLLVGRLLHKGC